MMKFSDYITMHAKYNILSEQEKTLQDLIDNFRNVFPYSKKDLNIKHFRLENDPKNPECTDFTAIGMVASESKPGVSYEVKATFHRDDTSLPFNIHNIGKVSCDCNAYRYNISHPNKQNNVQVEPIPSYASISNRVHNPDKIPSVCKHVYSFLIFLYNKGIIRN